MVVFEQDLVVITTVCVIAGQATTAVIALFLLKLDISNTSCGILIDSFFIYWNISCHTSVEFVDREDMSGMSAL